MNCVRGDRTDLWYPRGSGSGTVWRISRPSYNQRVFYNGHKRVHSLKFQAVVTPEYVPRFWLMSLPCRPLTHKSVSLSGLTADLSPAYVGSRHDTAIWDRAGLEDVLTRDAKGFEGLQMMLYGDQGYRMSAVLMTPYPGNRLTAAQAAFNRAMSSARVAVEHEFGRTRNMERMSQYEGLNLLFVLPDGVVCYT